ncbi:MAG: sigma-70 family RNA polymerase sigma factor [Deltaproteobacteria bacterium]|nr:sigma-70 family RNA polymerase sigma factor [Deltaproteobacteria bacterium]
MKDLVQDTLVRAYRFYDRFEAGTNFKAWVLRIQMNTFVNRYRRATRERQVFDGPMAVPVGEGVMSRASMRGLTDPVGDAQRRLIAREINRAFEELSDEARAMVLLADVEELSYKEIAEVIGCPIGTVMSRLHRARKQLQVSLHNSFKCHCTSMRCNSASSKATTMMTSRIRFRSKRFVHARRGSHELQARTTSSRCIRGRRARSRNANRV